MPAPNSCRVTCFSERDAKMFKILSIHATKDEAKAAATNPEQKVRKVRDPEDKDRKVFALVETLDDTAPIFEMKVTMAERRILVDRRERNRKRSDVSQARKEAKEEARKAKQAAKIKDRREEILAAAVEA